MACTLRHSQACSRYLSPSRLSPPSGHSVNHDTGLPSLHRGSPPGTRPSAGLCFQTLPRQGGQANVLHPKTLCCKETPTCGLKTNEKRFYGAKNRYMNFPSAMRVVGSLNVDLPKGFSLPKKLFRKEHINEPTNEISPNDIAGQPESTTSVTANHSPGLSESEGQSSKPIKIKYDKDKRASSKDHFHAVEREKHGFVEAMHEQDDSVKTYYSTPDEDCNLTGDKRPLGTSEIPSDEGHDSRTLWANSKSSKDAPKAPLTATSQVTSTVEGAANLVKSLSSYLPKFSGRNPADSTKEPIKPIVKKKISMKEPAVPRSIVDRRTRGLTKALKVATSSASQLVRMEELCRHVMAHPAAKSLAVKEKVVPCLLRLRASKDIGVREQAMEALTLVGHINPVKGRGIRILSLDGGGTRGLVTIEILRRLEEACKMDIHQIFDYICGVSTGSLIGIMLGIHKLSLDQAENLYKTFSRQIFQQHKLMGVGKLVMSHSYYDAELWENILREHIGLKSFLESTREPNTPKVSSISTLMNMTKLSNFLFRNYNYPAAAQSQLPGSCKYTFWEAVRASSAAPLYYQQYKLDEWIHQDGGIITNNPTAIAIHESKLLWPSDPLQCVISIGTGRYQPTSDPEPSGTGLRDKLNKIIQSATDTEAVHTTLNDLLPPSTYFRFNPYMSEDFPLDEIRLDKWDQMTLDTQLYCRKNEMKLEKASRQLSLAKLPHQRTRDWLKYKATMCGL